jgi:hypothetical protein
MLIRPKGDKSWRTPRGALTALNERFNAANRAIV